MGIEARTVAYATIEGLLESLTPQDRAEVVRVVLMEQARRAEGVSGLKITPAELLLLRFYAEGASDAEIAESRALAASTVAKAGERLRGKLGAKNRAHAVMIAARAGLLR